MARIETCPTLEVKPDYFYLEMRLNIFLANVSKIGILEPYGKSYAAYSGPHPEQAKPSRAHERRRCSLRRLRSAQGQARYMRQLRQIQGPRRTPPSGKGCQKRSGKKSESVGKKLNFLDLNTSILGLKIRLFSYIPNRAEEFDSIYIICYHLVVHRFG